MCVFFLSFFCCSRFHLLLFLCAVVDQCAHSFASLAKTQIIITRITTLSTLRMVLSVILKTLALLHQRNLMKIWRIWDRCICNRFHLILNIYPSFAFYVFMGNERARARHTNSKAQNKRMNLLAFYTFSTHNTYSQSKFRSGRLRCWVAVAAAAVVVVFDVVVVVVAVAVLVIILWIVYIIYIRLKEST